MVGYRPEVNIKPWETTLKAIKRGAASTKWKNRKPYAYWKGNPWVSSKRGDLMKCQPSKDMDWNARLYSVVCVLINFTTVNQDEHALFLTSGCGFNTFFFKEI